MQTQKLSRTMKLSQTMKKKYLLQQILIKKNITCKIQYILLVFLLIPTEILIAVSLYCCLIKYGAKQKHSLPFPFTNNELKEIMF